MNTKLKYKTIKDKYLLRGSVQFQLEKSDGK